jgi:hypothetical protein
MDSLTGMLSLSAHFTDFWTDSLGKFSMSPLPASSALVSEMPASTLHATAFSGVRLSFAALTVCSRTSTLAASGYSKSSVLLLGGRSQSCCIMRLRLHSVGTSLDAQFGVGRFPVSAIGGLSCLLSSQTLHYRCARLKCQVELDLRVEGVSDQARQLLDVSIEGTCLSHCMQLSLQYLTDQCWSRTQDYLWVGRALPTLRLCRFLPRMFLRCQYLPPCGCLLCISGASLLCSFSNVSTAISLGCFRVI